MTHEQLLLLRRLDTEDWKVKTVKGKAVILEGRIRIAVADRKEGADLIVKIRNTYAALVSALAEQKAKDQIRGDAFEGIEEAVDAAVEKAVSELKPGA